MKNYLKIYMVSIGAIFLFSFVVNQGKFKYDTGFTFGTANLLLAFVMFFIGLIMLLANNKTAGKATIAASGLLLLTGGIFCSIFPFTMNGAH